VKVTTSKKAPRHTTFGELPPFGVTFRFGEGYYMNIQAVTLLYTGRVPDPHAVNAVCLNNGTLHYIRPGELIEIVEAELMVTND